MLIRASIVIFLLFWSGRALPGQDASQPAQPIPTTPSQQDVKQATQVIQAAAAQTSQKADSALKQAQVTEEKVTGAQKQIEATAKKVDDLVATEDDDSEHVLRRADATENDVKPLATRIETFRSKMEKESEQYSVGAVILLILALLCGGGSVASSLKNRGTLSALLALGVIALAAFNSYTKLFISS